MGHQHHLLVQLILFHLYHLFLLSLLFLLEFLELLEPKMEEDGMEYPRVQFAHGEPVDQYDAEASTGSGSKSIFDEMMDEFGDFGGDDSYDDEY